MADARDPAGHSLPKETKPPALNREEIRLALWSKTATLIASVLNTLFKWTGAVLVARYAIAIPFQSLAGRVTIADVAIDVVARLKAEPSPGPWLLVTPWILTVAAVLYAWRQRRLRRDVIERQQERIRRFEQARDPDRTSSTLTPRGDTRQEDLP